MSDEPALHVIKVSDTVGDEWRTERDRQKVEARNRYGRHLTAALAQESFSTLDPQAQAEAILDLLFVVKGTEGDDACSCSCHPLLPTSDFHDYGFGCVCQQTAEERAAFWTQWSLDTDAYWDSSEGREQTAAREAEEAELRAWVDRDPGVVVTTHGGWAPEQWTGSVDDHSFYFRERHDDWRIELDLRPSGRFYKAWTGGDFDDDTSFEQREIEEGDTIAEGTIGAAGYGTTPAERAAFIVGTIRGHLARLDCDIHRHELADLDLLFGRPLAWCPACGTKLLPSTGAHP